MLDHWSVEETNGGSFQIQVSSKLLNKISTFFWRFEQVASVESPMFIFIPSLYYRLVPVLFFFSTDYVDEFFENKPNQPSVQRVPMVFIYVPTSFVHFRVRVTFLRVYLFVRVVICPSSFCYCFQNLCRKQMNQAQYNLNYAHISSQWNLED